MPLALLFGGAMWGASMQLPALAFALPGRIPIALALAGLGLGFALAGVAAFRKAMTTINPMRPDGASALVTSGPYRFSRNPMYAGLLLALTGWAVHLSHLAAFLCLPPFVAYMNRFQIAPEERVLAAKFCEEFAAYRRSVRRWL
ncbi:MAG: isoprenylcysteine carboxylmethyltransferase family protein [Azospira sp.]|nr:isoprenylcysteine carboxylmethyltransferase family protein [Azospira sp.]